MDLEEQSLGGSKTEYRIITKRTFIADRYLQFRSDRSKRNFPDFWNTHKVDVWRYIPGEEMHIFDYLSEDACPTSIPLGGEGHLLNCFHGQEDLEVIPFTRRFPDIKEYFNYFNSLREKHLEEEKAADTAGTTTLILEN